MKYFSETSLNLNFPSRQRGATLIVALVLLAVVTVLGLTSIRSSNLEIKMAASARDRVSATEKAQAALSVVEELLTVSSASDSAPGNRSLVFSGTGNNVVASDGWPNLKSFLLTCTDSAFRAKVGNEVVAGTCFTNNCNKGLCFTGDMQVEDKSLCKLENPDTDTIVERWKEKSVWDNADRYGVVNVRDANGALSEVRYLAEMLCFAPRSDQAINDDDLKNGVPLYRITVRAEGDAKRSTVMAQSIFKGNIR